MGASPAAGGATAVRDLCDSEVADRVVDHHSTGAQAPRDGFAASGVAGPNAGRERKGRIVGASDRFFAIAHGLHGQNGAEGLFLKEFHGGIDVGDDGGLEEIGTHIDARIAAAKNACTAADGIFD